MIDSRVLLEMADSAALNAITRPDAIYQTKMARIDARHRDGDPVNQAIELGRLTARIEHLEALQQADLALLAYVTAVYGKKNNETEMDNDKAQSMDGNKCCG